MINNSSLYYNGGLIILWEEDILFDDRVLSFSLNSDSSKIIVEESRFRNKVVILGQEATLDEFGSIHKKFREFRSAEDFQKKFNQLVLWDIGKDDIIMSDYFPKISWKNFILSWHDGDKNYLLH